MQESQKDYQNLHHLSRQIQLLSSTNALLEWDQETHMPENASHVRSEQIKTLTEIIHKKKSGSQFTRLLSRLIDVETGQVLNKTLSLEKKAALQQWRRDWRIAKALPTAFTAKFAKLTSQSILAWRSAKNHDQFAHFAPQLEQVLAMSRRKAELLGYHEHPYDALIDLFEPGMTTKELRSLFSLVKVKLAPLISKIQKQKAIDDHFLHGSFSPSKQIKFARQLIKAMGYDFQKGRLDFSTHPFSTAFHPTDSRITMRIHPTSLMSAILVALHETGHALYEMGLPEEHFGSPLGESVSLGMHESQSRWWETLIGQSKAYWRYFLPHLKALFPKALEGVSLDQFFRAINKVTPSLIRVEADELTYTLHIILRFELEIALIEGTVAIKDLPDLWNEKMTCLLGVTPSSPSEGCLQDIHWSMGAFGYFPTYALGNMYAAQLFCAFEKSHPQWEQHVAKGNLLFIKDWLQENIHQHGRRF